MSAYVFKLPDLGEGTVEAELLAWHVKPGDLVKEDQILAEVMTDKAAVEVTSPVSGRVVTLASETGEMVRVGAELIVFDTMSDAAPGNGRSSIDSELMPPQPVASVAAIAKSSESTGVTRVMASPSTRRLAREAGIDLSKVRGSGPAGRIVSADLLVRQESPSAPSQASTREGTEEIRITGLRRVIAQRMSESKRTIPHFGYVEEVDVTSLESLRTHLNGRAAPESQSLTYLPFIVLALTRALAKFPQCNAVFDAERNVVVRHRAVHVGIATQTADGLLVPVLKHAEALSIVEIAQGIRELAQRARDRKSPREELSGSTITVSSLGKLGGIASTPVINAPEVAILGVNKSVERAVVIDGAIVIRRMMNLSSAFDHRFVDGHDAASVIQEIRMMLENPATLFMP